VAAKSKSKTRSRSRSRYNSFNTGLLRHRDFRSVTAAVAIFVIAAAGVLVYQHFAAHASGPPEIKSDLAGSWCMDLKDNLAASYTQVRSEPCDGRNAENFYLQDQFATPMDADTVFIHYNSTWCVNPVGSGTAEGTQTQIVRCDPNNISLQWHRFQPDDTYAEFRNVQASNAQGHPMCLSVPSGNTGAQLEIHACHRYLTQLWKVKNFQSPEPNCDSDPQTAGASGAHCLANQILQNHNMGANQMQCLDDLWNRESGWDRRIMNPDGIGTPNGGAFGIAQALTHGQPGARAYNSVIDLPGGGHTSGNVDQYPTYSPNNESAIDQIQWGLGYIFGVYGTPCAALAHENSHGWYGPMIPANGSPDGYSGPWLNPNGLE
jgi:hypothetical protein